MEPSNPWYAICVVGMDGTNAKRLTQKMATSDPSWSHDGGRIAFTRHEDPGEFTQSTQDDIFMMDGGDGDMRQITPERTGQSSWRPSWSPNGRQIALLRSRSVASSSATRYGDLFVMNIDGSGETPLTRGRLISGPSWSPDGQSIAISVGTAGDGVPTVATSDIYVVDVARGKLRQLTNTPTTFESAPAWSPDGSRIAFARWTYQTEFDGKGAIYVMNRDGSGERLVLSHRHFANGPRSLAWSPDGSTLAFETSSMLGCSSISLLEIATGAARPLTSCSRPIESTVAPTWQPALAPER